MLLDNLTFALYQNGHQALPTMALREKERDLTHPMTKAPTPTEKSKKQRDTTKRHRKPRLQNDCRPT